MEQVCACAEYWGRRYNLSQRQGRQGGEMAGGVWNVDIHGPAVVTEGQQERVIHAHQCWSFNGAGTFLLQINLGNNPRPVVSLMGDDATEMAVIREAIQAAFREAGENPPAATDESDTPGGRPH